MENSLLDTLHRISYDAPRRLDEYLRQTGTSQREIARRAGVPATSLAEWLHGRCRITVEAATRILAATGGQVRYEDWLVLPPAATRGGRDDD